MEIRCPQWFYFMRPLLELLSPDEAKPLRSLREPVADAIGLDDQQRAEKIPSGVPRYFNRINWAASHLYKAGIVEKPKRGLLRLSQEGQKVLAEGAPDPITLEWLIERYGPDFFKPSGQAEPKPPVGADIGSPEEQIGVAHEQYVGELRAELLTMIKEQEPVFFEQLVVDLMVTMGYGGSRAAAGEAIGGSGDGGIDGVINEDRLGINRIYLQAKRYSEQSVGRPDVQAFVGALQGRQATRGVFLTTSSFTSDARAFVENLHTRVVLVDGMQLCDLMIEHGLGVSTVETLRLQRVDTDYFEA